MGYYQAYAQQLSSWGFAVVQYDLPLFWIVKDGTEVCMQSVAMQRQWHCPLSYRRISVLCMKQVQYLEPLLEWLAHENASEDSRLHGMVDLDRIGVAGHSRGAKLAALHFAGAHRDQQCPTE